MTFASATRSTARVEYVGEGEADPSSLRAKLVRVRGQHMRRKPQRTLHETGVPIALQQLVIRDQSVDLRGLQFCQHPDRIPQDPPDVPVSARLRQMPGEPAPGVVWGKLRQSGQASTSRE